MLSFAKKSEKKNSNFTPNHIRSLLLDLFTIKNKSIEEMGYENATYYQNLTMGQHERI